MTRTIRFTLLDLTLPIALAIAVGHQVKSGALAPIDAVIAWFGWMVYYFAVNCASRLAHAGISWMCRRWQLGNRSYRRAMARVRSDQDP